MVASRKGVLCCLLSSCLSLEAPHILAAILASTGWETWSNACSRRGQAHLMKPRHSPRREELLLAKRRAKQQCTAMLCLLRASKNLFLLAQETTADHQPLAERHNVASGSAGGAESPQSHHPWLLLIHEEELQAPGYLSKPRGSTGKHRHPSKHSQKPSSIPRVRVSPGAGAAQQGGFCMSSLVGCSCPDRPCTIDGQGSPHVPSLGWEGHPSQLPHTE